MPNTNLPSYEDPAAIWNPPLVTAAHVLHDLLGHVLSDAQEAGALIAYPASPELRFHSRTGLGSIKFYSPAGDIMAPDWARGLVARIPDLLKQASEHVQILAGRTGLELLVHPGLAIAQTNGHLGSRYMPYRLGRDMPQIMTVSAETERVVLDLIRRAALDLAEGQERLLYAGTGLSATLSAHERLSLAEHSSELTARETEILNKANEVDEENSAGIYARRHGDLLIAIQRDEFLEYEVLAALAL